MSTLAKVEPEVTAEGRLFWCPALQKGFTIEAIEADPHLSLLDDETVAVSEQTQKEELGH